jgi:anti-sigma regulatory factor (Ser/Thr protein kinase)
VGLARAAMRKWLDGWSMAPERAGDILLVLSEALTNAAEHAHGFDESPIQVQASWTPEELSILISDTGAWGMPHAMADRGRGVGIIRALSDESAIDSTPRGTTVRVSFMLGKVEFDREAPRGSHSADSTEETPRPGAGGGGGPKIDVSDKTTMRGSDNIAVFDMRGLELVGAL